MNVIDQIRTSLSASTGIQPAQLQSSTNFAQIGIDSMTITKLIVETESHFGVQVSPSDMDTLVKNYNLQGLHDIIQAAITRKDASV